LAGGILDRPTPKGKRVADTERLPKTQSAHAPAVVVVVKVR
jgi:hypothetical protein